MAVPKRRVSHSRQGMRRSHQGLKPKQHHYCNRCGEPIRPHFMCDSCGWSNIQEREVVTIAQETEE